MEKDKEIQEQEGEVPEIEPKKEPEQEEVQSSGEKVFELVKQPTQYALMVETPEGEMITTDQLLVSIANEIRAIKKGIVG